MPKPKPETAMDDTAPRKRGRGGRPRNEPGTVRDVTIGVRVSPAEFAAVKAKADAMSMAPAHWMRQAALTRRLPSLPVPESNREQYAELARLAANLNQLAKAANDGRAVSVNDALLQRLAVEVKRLRLALLGLGDADDR